MQLEPSASRSAVCISLAHPTLPHTHAVVLHKSHAGGTHDGVYSAHAYAVAARVDFRYGSHLKRISQTPIMRDFRNAYFLATSNQVSPEDNSALLPLDGAREHLPAFDFFFYWLAGRRRIASGRQTHGRRIAYVRRAGCGSAASGIRRIADRDTIRQPSFFVCVAAETLLAVACRGYRCKAPRREGVPVCARRGEFVSSWEFRPELNARSICRWVPTTWRPPAPILSALSAVSSM